jgi:hypothetical protein
MRRYFESLRPADPRRALDSARDGLFLVRVARAQYRWHRTKPGYEIRFAVLKPEHLAGSFIAGRLSCTASEMWKLSWFLRDFGYDPETLERGEIDEEALVNLCGVIKISQSVARGIPVVNLESFAPATSWKEFSISTAENRGAPKVSS